MPSATKKRGNPRIRGGAPRGSTAGSAGSDKKSPVTKTIDKPDGPLIYLMNYASPLRRLYAFTIDLGLIMMVVYTVAPVSGTAMFNSDAAAQDLVFFFGYFVIPTTIWGRTPGKWVAGIIVVDSGGRTPGPAAIPREMIGRFVATIAAALGLIWLVFDPKRQGWHDKIAGTYVVENPYSGGPKFLRDFFKLGEKSDEDQAKSTTSSDQDVGEGQPSEPGADDSSGKHK